MATPKADLEREVLTNLTADAMAWILGLPRTTFLSRHPPKSETGGYDAREIVSWLLQQLADETTASPGTPSPALERWRTARATGEELELLERMNGLVPVADVKRPIEAVFRAMTNSIGHMISRHGEQVGETYSSAIDMAEREVSKIFDGYPEDAVRLELHFFIEGQDKPIVIDRSQLGSMTAEGPK